MKTVFRITATDKETMMVHDQFYVLAPHIQGAMVKGWRIMKEHGGEKEWRLGSIEAIADIEEPPHA